MLPLETKQSGGKLLPQSDPRGGEYLEEMSCRRYNKKEYHSYEIGTWNVRTLKQGGKLENFKTEMQKNKVSVLVVNEVRWTGQDEIRSGDYTVYYSGGEWAERGAEILVHKSIVRSVVNQIALMTESLLLS